MSGTPGAPAAVRDGKRETITRAYGFPIGRAVSYPKHLLHVVAPGLAERELIVRALSAVYQRLWRRIVLREGIVPAIDASIDREAFVYATVEAIFDTSKLRALGFEPKWKSLREGYPAVLAWFQANGWVPTYDVSRMEGRILTRRDEGRRARREVSR